MDPITAAAFDPAMLATPAGITTATLLITAIVLRPSLSALESSPWFKLLLNLGTMFISMGLALCAWQIFELSDGPIAIWNGIVAGLVAIGGHQIIKNTVEGAKGKSSSSSSSST